MISSFKQMLSEQGSHRLEQELYQSIEAPDYQAFSAPGRSRC